MSDPTPNSTAPVSSNAAKPAGILPKNIQVWVMTGVALLMVIVIALSGSSGTKERRKAEAGRGQGVLDPNQARIQEYRSRLDEQARQLAQEQARLANAKQSLGGDLARTDGMGTSQAPQPAFPSPNTAAAQQPEPQQPTKGSIEADREKREYLSLFASNVALSYRKEGREAASEVSVPTPTAFPTPVVGLASPQPTSPQALPSQSQAVPSVTQEQPDESDGQPSTRTQADPDRKPRGETSPVIPNLAVGKQYVLFEGMVLETVLTNRLNGSFAGPVNCMVTTNVYSHDHQRLLIPQGSRVLGEARRVASLGQQRLAVYFHRIVMPDGYTVNLDQFQGLNQVGETGLKDKVNRHYAQVFGASLAIGAIAGLTSINTRGGLIDVSAGDLYRQGVTSSLGQSSSRILDRFLNVLPEVTIREGHRVKVYLAGDLALPAYEAHRMPGNL